MIIIRKKWAFNYSLNETGTKMTVRRSGDTFWCVLFEFNAQHFISKQQTNQSNWRYEYHGLNKVSMYTLIATQEFSLGIDIECIWIADSIENLLENLLLCHASHFPFFFHFSTRAHTKPVDDTAILSTASQIFINWQSVHSLRRLVI